jgi:hypothetical protein
MKEAPETRFASETNRPREPPDQLGSAPDGPSIGVRVDVRGLRHS